MSLQQELIYESNVKIVKTMMRLLFIIVLPLFVISMLRFFQNGWLPVMYLHIFLVICVSIFNFWGAKISVRLQENFMILCFILLGIGATVHNGSIIYGSSFYLIAFLFTILFYSTKEVIIIALLIFFSELIFVNLTRTTIFIQDYLFLISLPVLSVFAVYIINHMRSNLLLTIEQLNLAKLEAQKATMAKSQFLAVMSHEIRTPLNGIILGSDLLNQSNLDEKEKHNIEIIKNSSETLLGIVNDILDFSKIDAGKLEPEYKPVDLNKISRKTLDLFRYKNDAIEIEYFIENNFPQYVITDTVKIRQIILNLLGNAFKFTKTGKVTLSLSFKSLVSDDAQITITISDTGIGIDEKNLSLLFQDFQQLDSSITREFGGTGLGLWITKKLVALLAGTIDVKSELGKGTVFTCRFNMKVEKGEFPQSKSKEIDQKTLQVGNKENLNILVVEDNEINQLLLQETLKRWGIKSVDIAADGAEAIKKCQLSFYDIIFMDMQMPGMDGVEATRRIRAGEGSEANANTLIVAITANTGKEDVQECFDAGMNNYISKPINRVILRNIIEKYFSN